MTEYEMTKVLIAPRLTEKSTIEAERRDTSCWDVRKDATKEQIKAAAEFMLGGEVLKVRTSNLKGKTKRTRGKLGRRKDVKKAWITMAPGAQQDAEAQAMKPAE